MHIIANFLTICVMLAPFCHHAACQTNSQNTWLMLSEKHFTLEYSAQMEGILPPPKHCVAYLKDKVSGFPTLNVIFKPGGSLQLETTDRVAKAVLDEYRAVGLTDARLIEFQGTHQRFVGKLEYSINSQVLFATVALIEGNGGHYIITCLNFKNASSAICQRSIETFRVSQPNSEDNVIEQENYFSYLFSAIVLVSLLAVFALTLFFVTVQRVKKD